MVTNRILRWLPVVSVFAAMVVVVFGVYTLTYTRSHSADAIAHATTNNCARQNQIITDQNAQSQALRVILWSAKAQLDAIPKDKLSPGFDIELAKRQYQDLIDASKTEAPFDCQALVNERLRQ